jgi:hypothetical protein
LSDTGEKWEYNETVYNIYIDFMKAYDSVRREVLYTILIELGVPMKLGRSKCVQIKRKVRTCKCLPHRFPIQNINQGNDLSSLLFSFALEYTSRKVQKEHVELKLNGTHQFLAYADDVNLLGNNITIINRNAETLTNASREVGL